MSSPVPFRLGLVVAGGAIGSAARIGIGLALTTGPGWAAIPWATFLVNMIGSFLLGVLAARLPGSSAARVFLGTGVLGGFTTYSAFTVGTVALWQTAPLLAAGYALGSLVLGVGAAALGLDLARPPRARRGHGG